MTHTAYSRRRFIGSMLKLAGGGSVPFALNLAAMGEAVAQTANDYKALVCLYMAGGNDGFNTVLATDADSTQKYAYARGPIALTSTRPIYPANSQGHQYGLHTSLADVASLFGNRKAAIVSNVGTLVKPLTKAQYLARTEVVPAKLFSHNDQQSLWQSNRPEGADAGWGGLMADQMAAQNIEQTFGCISVFGNAVFLSGKQTQQFQITPTGLPRITNLDMGMFGIPAAQNPLRRIATAAPGNGNGNQFERAHADVVNKAIVSRDTLTLAMSAAAVDAPSLYLGAVNPLAQQLQAVAKIIAGRDVLHVKRQVFYVSIGGFDTHDGQLANQADLLARVNHAIAYFDGALGTLGNVDMRSQVTLFTASDFGRTLVCNGDGSDHGWGSHHFVVGGAVKGGDIYGTFPPAGLGHDWDIGSGILLPTTSVDQYGATLASWFGVNDSNMSLVFPNIGNFSASNLGFMN